MDQINVDCTLWQILDWLAVLEHKNVVWMRARGGSKSRDAVILAVFLALYGKRVIWRSASEPQLEMPLVYFKDNPFVRKVTKKWIYVHDGERINLGPLTEKQSRSMRADVIIFDEEREMANLPFLAAQGMLSGCQDPIRLHASTGQINSVFQDTHDAIMKQNPKAVRIRDWKQCPWIGEDHVKAEEAIWPKWHIDMEYRCLWTVAGGRVFEKVVNGSIKDFPQGTNAGVDFNGLPGHVLVEIAYNDKNVWITNERTFAVDDKFSINTYTAQRGLSTEFERWGFNEGFIIGMNGSKVVKNPAFLHRRLEELFIRTIHIDPIHTPNTYKDIIRTAYAKDGSMEKYKDSHWVDALLHAMHLPSPGVQFYQHNPAMSWEERNLRNLER